MCHLCFSLIGNQEEINKFSKRLVKVTRQHGEDCKKLLALMGVPYIEVSRHFFGTQPFINRTVATPTQSAAIYRLERNVNAKI